MVVTPLPLLLRLPLPATAGTFSKLKLDLPDTLAFRPANEPVLVPFSTTGEIGVEGERERGKGDDVSRWDRRFARVSGWVEGSDILVGKGTEGMEICIVSMSEDRMTSDDFVLVSDQAHLGCKRCKGSAVRGRMVS